MKKLLILTILLICTLAFSEAVPDGEPQDAVTSASPEILTVKSVIDCRTLKLSDGQEVVLIGITCPPGKMGQEATTYVRRIAKNMYTRLEYDVEKRDKYDRLLVYVFIDTGLDWDDFKSAASTFISISRSITLKQSLSVIFGIIGETLPAQYMPALFNSLSALILLSGNGAFGSSFLAVLSSSVVIVI